MRSALFRQAAATGWAVGNERTLAAKQRRSCCRSIGSISSIRLPNNESQPWDLLDKLTCSGDVEFETTVVGIHQPTTTRQQRSIYQARCRCGLPYFAN